MLLVIGATGTVGREVVSQLCAASVPVRALVRTTVDAGLSGQAEIALGDLTEPDSLHTALAGIDGVFLVWTAAYDTAPEVIARIARQARRIVFLTSGHTIQHPFFQQPNPLRLLHAQMESLIRESGVEYTFLRPGMFAANALRWWAPRIRAGELVRWPYLSAATAPIHERDISAVALRALTDGGHAGAEYALTGPDSLTQAEQLSVFAQALGRPLLVEEISRDAAREEWMTRWKWPAWLADMLLDAWAAALGQPAFVTQTVEAITGTPARTFAEWAADRAGFTQ